MQLRDFMVLRSIVYPQGETNKTPEQQEDHLKSGAC